MTGHSVILFHSNNHVMWAAKQLKKEGIGCKMISIPRHLSSDCGYCLKIKRDDSPAVKSILDNNIIEYAAIETLEEAQ